MKREKYRDLEAKAHHLKYQIENFDKDGKFADWVGLNKEFHFINDVLVTPLEAPKHPAALVFLGGGKYDD